MKKYGSIEKTREIIRAEGSHSLYMSIREFSHFNFFKNSLISISYVSQFIQDIVYERLGANHPAIAIIFVFFYFILIVSTPRVAPFIMVYNILLHQLSLCCTPSREIMMFVCLNSFIFLSCEYLVKKGNKFKKELNYSFGYFCQKNSKNTGLKLVSVVKIKELDAKLSNFAFYLGNYVSDDSVRDRLISLFFQQILMNYESTRKLNTIFSFFQGENILKNNHIEKIKKALCDGYNKKFYLDELYQDILTGNIEYSTFTCLDELDLEIMSGINFLYCSKFVKNINGNNSGLRRFDI